MSTKKITCLDCGQVNRVPGDRLSAAKCGTCGAKMIGAKVKEVDFATLEKAARNDDVPLVVDIWAPWCGPCRMMGPEFSRAAQQLSGDARLVKINADSEPTVSVRYSIRGIPTVIRFQGGRETKRHAGAMRAPQIVDWTRS